MKFVNMIITFAPLTNFPLLLVASSAFPNKVYLPTASHAPATFPGYNIGTMGFNGTIGGYEVNLKGSVQDIFSQMDKLHPDFRAKIAAAGNVPIQARVAENKDGLICYPVPGQNWNPAPIPAIQDGINGLDSINGCCSVAARSCVRIACESDSAIWFCNDEYQNICSTCSYLASYAQDIVNDCAFYSGPYHLCGGQEFDSDSYNIIIRDDSC